MDNKLLISVSPELKILLYSSRTSLGAKEFIQLQQLLMQEVDWNRLMALAKRHGLQPILYHTLASLKTPAIPGKIDEQLKLAYFQNAADTVMLNSELGRVLTALDEVDIPVILHKGVTLGARIYGSPMLRESGDIDIFVPPDRIFETKQRLLAIGYEPLYELTRHQEKKYLRSDHHYALINKQKGILLEIHWDIADYSQAISVDWLRIWERTRWCELDIGEKNYTLREFAPEDELLLLLIHGNLHRWEKLKWLVDINEFILHYQNLNWSTLMERAESWRIGRINRVGINLANTLFSTPIPLQVGRNINQDRRAKSLSRHVIDLIDTTEDPPQPDINRVLFVMQLRENWRDRLFFIWRLPTRLH